MKSHPIQLEIPGPTLMWTRLGNGALRVLKNPLRLDRGEGRVRCRIQPPISAAKGVFESVLRCESVKGIPSPRQSESRPPSPRPTGRIPSPLWGEGGRRPDEVRRTNFQSAPDEVPNSASRPAAISFSSSDGEKVAQPDEVSPPGDAHLRNREPRSALHAADGVRPVANQGELNRTY